MYTRIVPSKQKHGTYHSLQIVESYRDPKKSKHPITRIVAHLGQVDTITERDVDNVINGLCKAIGRPTTKEAEAGTAYDFGHIWAIIQIWKTLKFETIFKKKAKKTKKAYDLEAHIRLMVTNRLCDPRSKLGLLQWLEGVYFPGIDRDQVEYVHLLRAMDWLIEQKEDIEKELANRFITLFDRDVDLVFYDITSTYFEGDRSITAEDIRKYGYSRDHRPDRRQVVIGVVMTRDGIPLAHHVFSGERPDKTTVSEVVRDLKERFGFRNVVFVGDRGMLSDDNLETLLQEEFGFIVAHPLRRNNEVKGFIESTHEDLNQDTEAEEQFLEQEREGVKFVMAYDPALAEKVRKKREKAMETANSFIQDIKARLKRSLDGKQRGRPLTPEGALIQARDYLKKHGMLRYYHLELGADRNLRMGSDTQTRAWEKKIDGKLIVETTQLEMAPEAVIKQYKDLQIIERGFRCLKSTLKLRPVYHWTERRIRAHIFICVLALQVERLMYYRLKELKMSVGTAMEKLRQIKAGNLILNSVSVPMLTKVQEGHKEIYQQLEISFPNIKQLSKL